MSVTVMRHICFIECPYLLNENGHDKSIPPTGKLAMLNFPPLQKKKHAIKLNPMNCPPPTLLPTNVHPVSIIYNSSQNTFVAIFIIIHLPQTLAPWKR